MEPRFFKRGNDPEKFKELKKEIELQWNHVFLNVEMSVTSRRTIAAITASMEPRFFKRGNGLVDVDKDAIIQGFNGTTFF